MINCSYVTIINSVEYKFKRQLTVCWQVNNEVKIYSREIEYFSLPPFFNTLSMIV
jgi:hypothetical protein